MPSPLFIIIPVLGVLGVATILYSMKVMNDQQSSGGSTWTPRNDSQENETKTDPKPKKKKGHRSNRRKVKESDDEDDIVDDGFDDDEISYTSERTHNWVTSSNTNYRRRRPSGCSSTESVKSQVIPRSFSPPSIPPPVTAYNVSCDSQPTKQYQSTLETADRNPPYGQAPYPHPNNPQPYPNLNHHQPPFPAYDPRIPHHYYPPAHYMYPPHPHYHPFPYNQYPPYPPPWHFNDNNNPWSGFNRFPYGRHPGSHTNNSDGSNGSHFTTSMGVVNESSTGNSSSATITSNLSNGSHTFDSNYYSMFWVGMGLVNESSSETSTSISTSTTESETDDTSTSTTTHYNYKSADDGLENGRREEASNGSASRRSHSRRSHSDKDKTQSSDRRHHHHESQTSQDKECFICSVQAPIVPMVTLKPCGHGGICKYCVEILLNDYSIKCPVCRKPIKSYKRKV